MELNGRFGHGCEDGLVRLAVMGVVDNPRPKQLASVSQVKCNLSVSALVA